MYSCTLDFCISEYNTFNTLYEDHGWWKERSGLHSLVAVFEPHLTTISQARELFRCF